MAPPFNGIHAPAVEIFPGNGQEGKGKGAEGKKRGGKGKGKGRKGMNSRGIDTFKRRRHFLGVNGNYNIL